MSFKCELNRVLPGVPNVESPLFEEILANQDIGDETRRAARALHNDGFAVIEFPEPDFDAISQRIIEGLADRYEDPVRIQDAWRFNLDVLRIAANSRIMELLRVIYGRRPIPFQTLNFRVGTRPFPAPRGAARFSGAKRVNIRTEFAHHRAFCRTTETGVRDFRDISTRFAAPNGSQPTTTARGLGLTGGKEAANSTPLRGKNFFYINSLSAG